MAITQGLNGTLAQDLCYNDIEPIYFRIFKKTVPVDNTWEDRVFYEIKKFPMGRNETIDWLLKHYSNEEYAGTWWTTVNGICMNQKIYTHYKLIE